jgi:hypothetical protein
VCECVQEILCDNVICSQLFEVRYAKAERARKNRAH